MTEAIQNFFLETVGREWCVFFCSMIPIIELRGAIPLGAALGLPWWQNYIISVIGNFLPVPFILLFINAILHWMANSNVKFFNKVANWLFAKAEKNREKIEKYAALCGISEAYFYRCFHKWAGKSPVEYRNLIRLSNAEAMLRYTDIMLLGKEERS